VQEDGRQRAGLTRPELDVRQLEPAAFSKLIHNNQQLGMVEAFLLVGPQTCYNDVITSSIIVRMCTNTKMGNSAVEESAIV
jgi:hypothetical protein